MTLEEHSKQYDNLVLARQRLKERGASKGELEYNRLAIGREIRQWNIDLIKEHYHA